MSGFIFSKKGKAGQKKKKKKKKNQIIGIKPFYSNEWYGLGYEKSVSENYLLKCP